MRSQANICESSISGQVCEIPFGYFGKCNYVKVDRFHLPAYFIVLDMEEDKGVPLILGRPFMAIAWTLIDVEASTLTLRVQGNSVALKLFEAVKCPLKSEKCFHIDILDGIVHANFASQSSNDEPLNCLINQDATSHTKENVVNLIVVVDSTPVQNSKWWHVYESLGGPKQPLLPSSERTPKLELKPLPIHLEYAYLREKQKLHPNESEEIRNDAYENVERIRPRRFMMLTSVEKNFIPNRKFCTLAQG